MVDLHPAVPGMPDGHRWLELNRWGMAWRVTLWSVFVGMSGILLLVLIDQASGDPRPGVILGSLAIWFGVVPSTLFGLLAFFLGPWLRRWAPFTQGVIFAVISVAACGAVMTGLSIADALRWGCDSTAACLGAGIWGTAVLMLAGLPLAIMSGAGLGVAILVSNSARARRIASWMLLGVAVVFVTLCALTVVGSLDPLPAEYPARDVPTAPGPNSPY